MIQPNSGPFHVWLEEIVMLNDAGNAPEEVSDREIVRLSLVTSEVSDTLESGAILLKPANKLKNVLMMDKSGDSGVIPVMETL